MLINQENQDKSFCQAHWKNNLNMEILEFRILINYVEDWK